MNSPSSLALDGAEGLGLALIFPHGMKSQIGLPVLPVVVVLQASSLQISWHREINPDQEDKAGLFG